MSDGKWQTRKCCNDRITLKIHLCSPSYLGGNDDAAIAVTNMMMIMMMMMMTT